MFNTVPDLGLGFGLLSQGHAEEQAKAEMERLAKPLVSFQYRGAIDESFRADAPLPVIGVIHNTEMWKDVAHRKGDPTVLHLNGVLRGGVLHWNFVATSSVDPHITQQLGDGIHEFLFVLMSTRDGD